ncbi:MAG: 50S ribosomal protein L13 [Planctomycetes bacterium]|nr:50S ribosomal protein L13 [Planctomycetota bacterium]
MHATTHVRSQSLPERWLLYDASKFTLGRMASQIAMNLMGKDTPHYTASEKNGAFVVVINARNVKTTGTKNQTKTYDHYTGYPGGHVAVPFEDLRERRADEIVRQAVKRMLPKTTLGRDMLRRLKVYPGLEHPHSAQQPVQVDTIRG